MQPKLERLHTLEVENAELKRQVSYYESRRSLATNLPNVVPSPSLTSNLFAASQLTQATSVRSNRITAARQPTPAAVKAHSVKANETPTSIAKKYGVSVTALMAANPGVEARRLRIGQSLNLPVP
jgi:LysM repeat protein